MKRLEKAAAKAVNTVINIETFGWPPACVGSIYQPARPQGKRERKEKEIKCRNK